MLCNATYKFHLYCYTYFIIYNIMYNIMLVDVHSIHKFSNCGTRTTGGTCRIHLNTNILLKIITVGFNRFFILNSFVFNFKSPVVTTKKQQYILYSHKLDTYLGTYVKKSMRTSQCRANFHWQIIFGNTYIFIHFPPFKMSQLLPP